MAGHRNAGAMKSPAHVARTVWKHGSWAAAELARRGRPRHLVFFCGDTLGDDLMCTAVLRELRERGERGVWMMTRFPALFEGNPDADQVVPYDWRYQRMVNWVGGREHYAEYGGHDHVADVSPSPERHIIALMCQTSGITGPVALRPYLHLTDAERARGRVAPRQIALHSSGAAAQSAMKNKEWYPDRLQQVVDALRGDFSFVQLGAPSDPPLDGCTDLRGKTSLRESAAVLANSVLLLGQVGFLMHLARAVDRPAVIIYGGREKPWQTGYVCNTNVATDLWCSPCWRWNVCNNPIERDCMRRITAEHVIEAVRERAARADEPLAVETHDVPPLAGVRAAA